MIEKIILLDFKVDYKELEIDLEESPEKAEEGLISETYFVFPIYFSVGDTEFFSAKKNSKLIRFSMPIVNLASQGLHYIRQLPKKKKIIYDLPEGIGKLYLEINTKNKVHIKLTVDKKETEVEYQKLLDAFLQFREKVRNFLKENVPQLKKHTYWGPWVAGEELPEEMEC